MEYTINDVITYWQQTRPKKKTRVRNVLDPRNYILALLYYKFHLTEHELQSLMDMHHTSVNHNKRHPYNLIKIKESVFMNNTTEVREKFPFEFPPSDKSDLTDERYTKKYSYTVTFDKKTFQKIKAYSKIKGLDPRTALRDLLEKSLAIWEE